MKTLKPFGRIRNDTPFRVHLCDSNPEVAAALAAWFHDVDAAEVLVGDLLELACDALVAPANSFGDMSGGLDKRIDDFHGGEAQRRLLERIAGRWHGELPVGSADVLALPSRRFPFLVVAPTMRARAVAIWMLGLPLGLGLANGAGGWILQNWGWRNAFYVAAIPGILCAVAALLMREPKRGTREEHAVGDRCRPGNPYFLVLSIPTMLWIIASGALHNFNMYALGAFVSPFLVRYHHMSFLNAGWVAACVYGFSGIVGLTGGGYLADRLYAKRVDGRLIVGTASIVICAPLMFLALMRPGGDVVGFALLMGTGSGVMFAYYSTVYSTIHDVVEPSLRGTAMALYFFAMYVLGASLGPVGTGLASDYFTFQKASAAGAVEPLAFGAIMAAELRSLVGEAKGFNVRALEPFRAEGLHTAMYIVPILAVLLALVLLAASRTVAKDVEKLQAWMRTAPAKTS